MPPASSTIAGDVDKLFYLILYISIFFFLLVVIGALIFVLKYRRRGDEAATSSVDHSLKLELAWTVIPIIIVVILFALGFSVYLKMNVVPKDALEIKVTAQRWMWTFDYPNGNNTVNELIVPAGKPIRLLMSSTDVIHSFYVPDFRIKMDLLPNRYTLTWFEAPYPGEHNLTCAEYCGKGHSEMMGKVKVLPEREYTAWLESGTGMAAGMSLEQYGEALYKSRRCVTCHSIDGSPNVGPTFQGLFGSQVPLEGGGQAHADENYIRESILEPQAKVAAGYQPVMPTFQGILKDRDVDALIAYMKTLSK